MRERHVRPLFLAAIVTGSFLLFLTQPMVARMALPRIGGAPAVWNSAMLVYQLLLLGGYAYAHWLSKLRPRRQVGLHLVLLGLAALWLPIGLLEMNPPAAAQPAFWVPWFLFASIGPLFFIVSAQAPLMQRWYALETSRGDPYPLYSASNLGSFAGLLSYPLIVEPLFTLQAQSLLWSGLYALLFVLVAACALTVPGDAVEAAPQEDAPAPTVRQMLYWVVLAAVPSGLMLSTTTHLTTDIVAMPLLWALPLGLYLLSFVVAFAHRRAPADSITALAPLIILIAGGLAFSDGSRNPFVLGTLGLLLLFAVAAALHTALFRTRPAVGHLTGFYLALSVGGMLGGLFVAIIAPLLFDWIYEHPLLILAAALLVPQFVLVPWPRRLAPVLAVLLPLLAFAISWATEQRWFGEGMFTLLGSVVVSLIALACMGRPVPFVASLAALMLSYGGWSTIALSAEDVRTRSYFGVYEVTEVEGGAVRRLTHGTTLHGLQMLKPGFVTEPTTYYARRSGVGLALENAAELVGRGARIGVVGLGAGTLACYARPDQEWLFFEIDPAVAEVARTRFSFLSECAPEARIVLGDARLTLGEQPPNSIDLLAVDAFSSDAVPMHLVTREALDVYGDTVQPGGIVLFHISNRYLDLKPVIADIAASRGWTTALMQYVPTEEEKTLNAAVSVWVAMSRDPAVIDRLLELSGEDRYHWEVLERRPGFAGWTDDYASILPILNRPSWWPFGGE